MLEKRAIEILLNGGLNTTEHAEAADPPAFRQLDGFRFGDLGRLEKACHEQPVANISGSWISGINTGPAHTIFARQRDVSFLMTKGGVGHFQSGVAPTLIREELDYTVSNIQALPSVGLSPYPCSVSRQILHSAQFSNKSQGIIVHTACVTPSGHFVLAWIESGNALGGNDRLFLRAYTKEGVLLSETTETTKAGMGPTWISHMLKSCRRIGSGANGAYVGLLSDDEAAPHDVVLFWYDEITRQFVRAAAPIATDVGTRFFEIVDAGSAAGLPYYYLVYQSRTTGFLTVTRGNDAAATTLVHAGTHPFGQAAMVKGPDKWLILTTTAGVGGLLRGEILGAPAVVTTLATAAAGENFYGVTAAIVAGISANTNTCCAYVTVTLDTAPQKSTYVYFIGFDAVIGLLDTERIVNGQLVMNAVNYRDESLCGIGVQDNLAGSVVLTRARRYLNGSSNIDAVARCFHSRLYSSPQLGFTLNQPASWAFEDSIYMVSTCDASPDEATTLSKVLPQTLMLVRVDMAAATPPLAAVEVDGVALLASGLLTEFDGVRVTEAQPIETPVMFHAGASGALSHVAIYTWVDVVGRLHRSAPSAPISTAAGDSLYVQIPPLASFDGVSLPEISVELYSTEANGTLYYLSNTSGGERADYVVYDVHNVLFTFVNVQAGAPGNAALYTDGGELGSEPPPSFHHIALVGDRMFGVDAEDRTRWWCSKPIVAGFAVEWNTQLTGKLYDQAVAVVDFNGLPVLLCEAGVWVLYGEGPNALGAGTYAPPRKVAEVGCVSRASVARVPQGVVFQTERGFVVLASDFTVQPVGLPIEKLTNARTFAARRVLYDATTEQVHVFGAPVALSSPAASLEYVLSLREGKWTERTRSAYGGLADSRAYDAAIVHGDLFIADYGAEILRVKRPSEVDYNASRHATRWATPWVKLDGIAGYGRLWRMILSQHVDPEVFGMDPAWVTLDLTLYADFDEGAPISEWSYGPGGIASWKDVVRIVLRPAKQRVTAVKLLGVTGYDPGLSFPPFTQGITPLSLRLEYGVDPVAAKSQPSPNRKGSHGGAAP